MDRIVAPIIRNARGAAVRNLQDALLLLLAPAASAPPPPERRALLDKVAIDQRNDVYGDATLEAVAQFQRDQHGVFNLPLVTGEQVDEPTAAAMNKLLDRLGAFTVAPTDVFVITGRVEFEDGTAAVGVRVDAFDRDIGRHRVLLGDAEHPVITDENGAFPAIRYRASEFVQGEGAGGPNADLVFEVTGATDLSPHQIVTLHRRTMVNGAVVDTAVADVVLGFDAKPVEEVRIVIAGRPSNDALSEYARLMRALEPLLIEVTTPADFDQEQFRDVDFVARETGWDRALVETMMFAWQLARAASPQAQLLVAVVPLGPFAETFYGMLRRGAPTEVAALSSMLSELLEQRRLWAAKLSDSIGHRIIDGTLELHLARLRGLVAAAAAQPGDGRRGSIGDVLARADVSGDDSRALVSAYQAHAGTIEEFWTTVVPSELGWADAKIRQAQTTLQLADILSYDVPLMSTLQQNGVTSARDLVAVDRHKLVDMISALGPLADAPGATPEEQVARTVDAITAVVDATFPTEALAHVAQTSNDPALVSARDLLTRFFQSETATDGREGFDVRTSPVTSYLETNGERVFREMGAPDKALLTSQLQRLQRVFRLGGDRRQSEALLDLGLDSAFHVARFSPDHFVTEFGDRLGGADRASLVYARAEKIAGTVAYMYADLWQGANAAKPMAMMSAAGPDAIPTLKELPAYRALFDGIDTCDCADCQSFFSPAAYFVDLLHMLDRPTLGTLNPADVLFSRRPDLAHIQLTCENTNTRIPYVDLVTEVLESFVANRAPAPFNVPPGPPNRRLPTPSADELRVNPVYLTTASSAFADTAYTALQQAVFPLALPLNLPLETTRDYLDHLDVARADLMGLLDRDMGGEPQIARSAEILRLSPEEFELVTGATFTGASSARATAVVELFGLSTGATPTTLFNHATPEFAVNVAKPDPRAPSIRSLQNILSIISPAPIPITGVYDAATAAAVNAFLTKQGLAANGRTDAAFWDALAANAMPSLSVLVSPVPMLLDRSGLTYEELVALVKTRFVNPTLQGEGDLDYLARLGIPGFDIRAWIQAGLPVIPAPILKAVTDAGEDPTEFTTWVQRRTRAVVINTSFASPCDLDGATLMHMDGSLLTPDELVTLFRFIRLWRTLGWSAGDLDLVLAPGALTDVAVFNSIHLLANVNELHDRLDAPITELVTIWQSIPTVGTAPLYDRLFRNRAAQLIDPILALNRERTELEAAAIAPPPALSDHLGPVLAAFRLSAQDMERVRTAIGLADDPTLPPASRPPLTLVTLSAIYSQVSFARTLGISVRELLALRDLSGLALFDRPDRVPHADALLFADIVDKVRASGVKVSLLEYLCRAVPQPPALPGSQRGAWSRTIATIVAGLQAIVSEEPIKDDADGEELTARLTALVGADDARATTALIYGRDFYKVKLAGLPAAFVFPAGVRGRMSYEVVRNELRIAGAMSAADRALLLAAPGVPAAIQPAYTSAVKALDLQARAFVARALKPLFSPAAAEAALIDLSSLDSAGAPVAMAIDAKLADVLERRRNALSRSLIKQTLSTSTGLSADIIGLLLENASVLTATSGAGPAMEDYQTIGGNGLDAEYFGNKDLTGTSIVQRVDASVGFDLKGAVPAPGVPAVGFSVRWMGNVYVPAAGEVTFRARASDGVRVTVNGAAVLDEWRDQPVTDFNATLRLDGGQFYPIVVEYYNKTGGALLELRWSSPSIPVAVIPPSVLYTTARFDSLLQRIERVAKIALLLAPFTLTARDVQLLAEHGDITLDLMPLVESTTLAAAEAMFRQWLTLYDFAALRDRFPASEVSLMEVPAASSVEDAKSLFVTRTGIAPDTLDAIVDVFTVRVFDTVTSTWSSATPDLTTLAWWERIADVFALVQQTGAAPEQLLAWAAAREITETPTGPETHWLTWTATDADGADRSADNARRAQEAKNVVRARYDEDRWRAEARVLNDALRVRRRSALTAFVLAMPEMMGAHVSNAGRLFEYLLIDVEMEPCMETSRIKQGISSVQMFVQRVLLNLESQVPPARVDSGRWEWMKVYRVWEANRRVFVYAENYIEPDLRDDKTPIFEELEAELRQDDLTEPNAERVVRHYLEKLDEVSKLTVCATCVDGDAGKLHVFARSAATPFVFYHRWLDNKHALSWTDGVWSPWQKLPVDVAPIEDGDDSGIHLLPIAWNRRLFLFWPLFGQTPDDDWNITQPDGFDPIHHWQVKLAWSEYKDGQWSPKRTGVPFVTSAAMVRPITRILTPPWKVFRPDHQTVHFVLDAEILGFNVAHRELTTTVIKANVLTWDEDPMLSGTVLAKEGDWAWHEHTEEGVTMLSRLPKPLEHYLDARIDGGAITLRLFCRFTGTPSGQFRTTKEDNLTVVIDGHRSDRKETSQIDGRTSGMRESIFQQVGTFRFPACAMELEASSATTTLDFNSMERPKDTINAFMGLRPASASVTALRLTAASDPILAAVPPRFELVDSDNRSGFERSSPFFYQDPKRCYLVTREMYKKLFDTPNFAQVKPDAHATIHDMVVVASAVPEHYLSVAPEASLAAHPWAHAAIVRWSAGPSVPAALRVDPGPQATITEFSSKRLVSSDSVKNIFGGLGVQLHPEYTFTPHWHPYACSFIAALNAGGVPALFTLDNESRTDAQIIFGGVIGGPMPIFIANTFEFTYKPDPAQVVRPYPQETVDFTRNGAYAQYNWETFFHAPMTVAIAYSRAGKYEDALRWFHYVFDPMTSDADTSAKRYWRFVEFRKDDTSRIEESIALLTYTGTDSAKLKARANLEASIQEWLDNPFNPHLIARRRPVVYMKFVFMKYLDTLIAWADELFQRDTIEAINEATQLYVLVANLLGPRPQHIPTPGPVAPETFQTLRARLDALSNAQVDLETRLPFTQLFGPGSGAVGQLSQLAQTPYFCLPQNDQLTAYWDTIADRLFKIRHCMTIDGTVRQLPLFEPPINPMLLVEAVAHGLDIGSVLNDLYAPLPRYRFTFMLQQALSLCNEVRSLGATLQSVLEKRDAEALSSLRAGQESVLLNQLRASKKLQIDEAEASRQALDETARMVTARRDYYDALLAQGLIAEEKDQLGSLDASNQQQEMASWVQASAQLLNLIPNITTGTSGGTTFGGSNLGSAASAVGTSFSAQAAADSYRSNRSSITGTQARRADDWRFQRDQAKRELAQVERQSIAARIRREVAEADLRNHETQIENARSVEELLRTKFTNEALYGWLEGTLRTVYFQCYKAAYEVAKATERTWGYAVGANATFVTYGAWDNSVRGLLAGERLYMQLKQMERAYLDQQVREFEISKDVSIAQLDPLALIALKETGRCEIDVPEWLFDIDYAGHYFRRLKTVAVSIPAVVGRATSLSATLTLLSSKVRETSRVIGPYADEENYRPDHLAVEAIAASTGVNDTGRFQLDFRDEKFLPFEGAGAIARWRIELPHKYRAFDYDTIADVVLHLKYTARRDDTLASVAIGALDAELAAATAGPLLRLLSVRHDFPNEWQTLRASAAHTANLVFAKDRLPLMVQGGTINVADVHTALILKEARPTVTYKATLTPGAEPSIALQWPGAPGVYRSDAKSGVSIPVTSIPADNGWTLQLTAPALQADIDQIRDILLVVRYTVKL
ncbi:MAG: neuraminidase-like domain-containing protein [bacterium]